MTIQKGQKFSYGYRTAGWVVAPVVKQLVTRVAPILGIKPQLESSTKFSKKSFRFLRLEVKITEQTYKMILKDLISKNKILSDLLKYS